MDYRSFALKAEENIAAAECEYHHRRYNASANRAYYAMFHAAIAALLYFGILPPKGQWGHGWVQATFNKQLIRRKKVYPAKLLPDLMVAMTIRETADYRETMISEKECRRLLRRAQNFVSLVKEKLEDDDAS